MEGIDVSIIDNIAKELKLSYVLRPQYDIEILKKLVFNKLKVKYFQKKKQRKEKN
ncbi:MAG: hypothetical protein ACLR43_07730 [Faecalibacillus faecis]